MMDKLQQKVGGIPVIVWGLVLGLALIVAMYIQRTRAKAKVASYTPSLLYPDIGKGLPPSNSPPTANPSGDIFMTNGSWVTQAINKLTGQGLNPIEVQQALGLYLKGSPLSVAQNKLVSQVITLLGAPPQGVDGYSVTIPDAVIPVPLPTPIPVPPPVYTPPPVNTPAPTPAPYKGVSLYIPDWYRRMYPNTPVNATDINLPAGQSQPISVLQPSDVFDPHWGLVNGQGALMSGPWAGITAAENNRRKADLAAHGVSGNVY